MLVSDFLGWCELRYNAGSRLLSGITINTTVVNWEFDFGVFCFVKPEAACRITNIRSRLTDIEIGLPTVVPDRDQKGTRWSRVEIGVQFRVGRREIDKR